MSTSLAADLARDLLAARVPLLLGVPVVEVGVCGMLGARGVAVPSVSNPGTLSIEWFVTFDKPGRMSTSPTHGTVIDPRERLGFLALCDELARRRALHALADGLSIRTLGRWEDPRLRADAIGVVCLALAATEAPRG